MVMDVRACVPIPAGRDDRKNRRADAGDFLGDTDQAIENLAPPVLSAAEAGRLVEAARGLRGGCLAAYVALARKRLATVFTHRLSLLSLLEEERTRWG
jgi:hypothetical protein